MTIPNINVVHCKRFQGHAEYIGRPTPLGNPFIKGKDGNREEVIEKYRDWFYKRIELEDNDLFNRELARLKKLLIKNNRLTLSCWCAPRSCHGDIVKEYLLEQLMREK